MCDTLVSITDDGVIFAKNSDRDPNEAQGLRWYPAADHASGTEVACTWITIPQVARTNRIVVSQPWWMWGAEIGTNEHGVTIGNEAVFTTQPLGEPALLGMDLLRLALERAASATDAVGVIVDLLERHGQGGPCSHERPGFSYHNSFLVADADGAIVLETAGNHWVSDTVRGRGRSISNGLTIDGFAQLHTDTARTSTTACTMRRARTEAAAARVDDVAAMFAALRDHGGDPAASTTPTWSRSNGALDAPCVHAGGAVTSTQTTASWVGDLRGEPLHWATGTSAPCLSVFVPVRVDDALASDVAATNRFDPRSRWWRHELLHRLALRDHASAVGRFGAARDRIEAQWLADPPSTADAFGVVDAFEATWLADLRASPPDDVRPAWLRDLWADLDRSALLDHDASPVTR